MVTSEMIKLIVIIVGGAVIGGIGQIILIKSRKNKDSQYQEVLENNQDSTTLLTESTLSKEEETARNYISQYKSQYPKESVKQGLLNYGISSENSEKYLNKYF